MYKLLSRTNECKPLHLSRHYGRVLIKRKTSKIFYVWKEKPLMYKYSYFWMGSNTPKLLI